MAEPYRAELRVHAYRMLGSFDDAEDAVQDAFLRAWRGRHSFDGSLKFRAWLYRITTNVCLDAIRRMHRRPQVEPRTLADVPWLQPFPDDRLDFAAPTTIADRVTAP